MQHLEIAGIVSDQQRDGIAFADANRLERRGGTAALLKQVMPRNATLPDRDQLVSHRAHSRQTVTSARAGGSRTLSSKPNSSSFSATGIENVNASM
ncbi:hypothetical protein ACVISU_007297 [Bradyrhizobium sp. USDA 4452]